MARYLVTGGAGFIGSHLVEELLAAGHAVRVLDDLSTGNADNLPPCAELCVASITDPAAVRTAFDGVDGCFHLAAVASVERTQKEWWRSHGVNLSGTIAVFEEVHRQQKLRGKRVPVIYASSAAVYGNPNQSPISEETSTCPLSPYAADKFGCEQHAAVGENLFELQTVGLRLFNVYGPRQNPNSPYSGVISIFCDHILNKRSIEIHGDGQQVRDFVYVLDVVRAFLLAIENKNLTGGIFNICTGVGTTICELGNIISRLCDLPFRASYGPRRGGDVRLSVGNPSKACGLLGFSARTSLEDGLAATLAWMTAHNSMIANVPTGQHQSPGLSR